MAERTIKSVNLLPEFFRTEKNSKFLASTLDQLIQPPKLERLDGYVGSKNTPNYNSTSDVYINESSPLRQNYQLEPALVVKDSLGDVKDVIGIDDLTNQIAFHNGTVDNFDKLYRSTFYSYDPQIDLDKFVNYQQYYWLVNGPDAVTITGTQLNSTSTFSVTDNSLQTSFIFSPDGLTEDPLLVLYRGNTYNFDITSVHKFYIKTAPTLDDGDQYNTGITNNGTSTGVISFVVDNATPNVLFYTSDQQVLSSGRIVVKNITDDSVIDVEEEILGKKNYISGTGISLSNGLKIRFGGTVYPESYRDRDFFVEGVGSAIKLVAFEDLEVAENLSNLHKETFDGEPFDSYAFDSSTSLPISPEYITINRSSRDQNPWSRYNRWFHKEIIDISAEANNVQPVYPADKRAVRPIIEFNADLKLYNFGSTGLGPVDLIDTITSDAFSLVEGSAGHHVDGVLLEQGNRVIFAADEDDQVRNKIYQVNYLTIDGKLRLELQIVEEPLSESSVVVTAGNEFKGTSWWFDGTDWKFAQQHTKLNEPPLFDLFDKDGLSYSDTTQKSSFTGNQLFGYELGTGANDSVLGFPLKYRNSSGVGSYLFKNYFSNDEISQAVSFDQTVFISTDDTFLRYNHVSGYEYTNVWTTTVTYAVPSTGGVYDPPLGLTNNPLNDKIESFTLSQISDHVGSMINRTDDFEGNFPGSSNLRDLTDLTKYGTRLVSHVNPLSFAQFFLGKKEHDLISALDNAADNYNQFKLAFLNKIQEADQTGLPREVVDQVLKEINRDKDILSPYFYSDMVAYGTDKVTRTWTVINPNNKIYPITNDFSLSELSLRSVLVYLNGVQLTHHYDYIFVENDSSIEFICDLAIDDEIVIDDYSSTEGCFVPATPSKLGIFPKFQPKKYLDNTYVDPVNVIQCHDGSIIVAYDDYRDNLILELENRIYNNIKVEYKPQLLDCNLASSGGFRSNNFSAGQIERIINRDFIKWSTTYGIDPYGSSSFDEYESRTFNYYQSYLSVIDSNLKGSWRAIFKFLYDTDRPHQTPWEMLGFSEEPSWWENEYGPAPYTSGNDILWEDLEAGHIRQGSRQGIYSFYSRPGLSSIIPVDDSGELIDPMLLAGNVTEANRRKTWVFGDQGPAETAWRKSSYWPFVIQKILSLTVPASYCSLMYDPARLTENISGQQVYTTTGSFLDPRSVEVYRSTYNYGSGFGVYIVEAGLQRNREYVTELVNDLSYIDYNLFYKVGGFINKSKTQIIIDAIDPTSASPGAILPPEDYKLILNVSNIVKSTSISGIIVQKLNGKFVVRGYDNKDPYFTMYKPFRTSTGQAVTVGGLSESYVVWKPQPAVTSNPNTALTTEELTSAVSSSSAIYYEKGQIVLYKNQYYRTKVAHKSGTEFVDDYFQRLPSLPVKGGTTVQTISRFENSLLTVPYGTEYASAQEVYDLILGYGQWLSDQGFVFDDFKTDLNSVIDWSFTAKEFLYWTTQNWSDNSVITLSPFADKIKFQLANSVVDDVFNSFYEYSLLQANGIPFPKQNISVNREDGVCTITTLSTTDGIYFARLNNVQKEHAIVFNNSTMFNDTIYDIGSGYRQRRMKVVGFRTKNWDGDFFSPGFVYDTAYISNWKSFTSYKNGDVVKFGSKYYSAKNNILGTEKFDFSKWVLLGERPVADLLPNFDYKINQFEDFYSLDIDNFDTAQQKMAQHLIGYTPRTYLNNIFTNPVSQYKFYQGFIREKGTRNAVTRLAKATLHNLQGELNYTEEWAFRIGHYGSFETFKEYEIPLKEGQFIENPQVINFVDTQPTTPNDLIFYSTVSDRLIVPANFNPKQTFVTTSSQDIFKIQTAGYVRFDDINITALNQDTILDIDNNRALQEGDYVWIASKKNGDWDVFRYDLTPARILSSYMEVETSNQMTFVTKGMHRLTVGDIVSISQFDDQVNGIYNVVAIPKLNRFTIEFVQDVFISEITPTSPGLLFKFVGSRYQEFDKIPKDSELLQLPYDSKIWLDDDGTGRWIVYKKIDNYSSKAVNSITTPDDQKLGYKITKANSNGWFVVSAPSFTSAINTGSVVVYTETANTVAQRFRYGINKGSDTYYSLGEETDLGESLVFDTRPFNQTGYGLIFAGAPAVSGTKSNDVTTVRYADPTASASSNIQEGLVLVSSIDPILIEEDRQRVLLSPYPINYERFGQSLFQIGDYLFVGAPGTASVGTGSVYCYSFNTASNTVNFSYVGNVTTSTITAGSRWGSVIHGANDASCIAISAPGYQLDTGFVALYSGTATNLIQTITSPFGSSAKFGEELKVSSNGDYVFVAAPDARDIDQSYGKVAVYKKTNNSYSLLQIIDNPLPRVGMKFGKSIDVNSDATELVISAVGTNRRITLTFDKFSVLLAGYQNDSNSEPNDEETTFDSGSTRFFDTIIYSGSAYVYNRKTNLFRLADELGPTDVNTGTNYGYSIAVNDNSIYVGAPAFRNRTQPDDARSAFYQYSKIDSDATSWSLLREQDDPVDVSTIKRVILLDSFKEEVIDYLDVIDPIKGKIAGIADEDIRFKSLLDPAVYSIGLDTTVNDVNTSWGDQHVGELWWDLSTAKYIIYEQGDLIYRKNNWGKLFPGCSIDVYEWVSSELLPSEWAAQADTAFGLTQGISGQPKYPDDSVLSIRQVYNPINNSFTNIYYYWVKNKITVPNTKNRRISAYQAATIIQDPTLYGLKYASVIDSDAVAISNVGNLLIGDRINLNIATDIIDNSIPRHTEWLLLQEGSSTSIPNSLLEKKLFDSLLGHDSLGNPVPDPTLSERQRYGIQIRPRQSMFKDRLSALRNLVEFSNQVLKDNIIVGTYSFVNLNRQEQIPNEFSGEYDQIVEDNEGLLLIDVGNFVNAELTCTVYNGKIRAVNIVNPGFGYKLAPKIYISQDLGAELKATINSLGQITSVEIVNAGKGFIQAPTLTVRTYSVIVQVDNEYNGKWTKFVYNKLTEQWVRERTQKYNTTLYWEEIDWISPVYNSYKDYAYTVNELYELDTLENIQPGDYVKVRNGGLGTFLILEKQSIGTAGTYGNGYNLLYAEKGTIRIKDQIWNFADSDLTFDNQNSFDQTLYDQTPDLELEYILKSLKEDLFVNDLKINWNLFFFKAVKYALQEQKLVDWAFKTSFINVVNYAGSLDQRPIYKLQNSSYYEDYLKEVKPFHTQIRNFVTNYSTVEPGDAYVTDFDLPAVYDRDLDRFRTVNLGDDEMDVYPWKSWADNYTYGIGGISVSNPGAGYTSAPNVIIVPATGDSGSGAEAIAYVRSGEVVEFVVINQGTGYKVPPTVIVVGGGSSVTETAVGYAQLENKKVRELTVGLKFDRITRTPLIENLDNIDSFLCNGSDTEFVLSWPALPDKNLITVTLDGNLVLSYDYTVEYFNNFLGDLEEYNKKYCKIVLLNSVPLAGQVLRVSYHKDIHVLNAVDRIVNYYEPTNGMPGNDLSQLMEGIVYPKTRIEGLLFDYTTKWGINWTLRDRSGNESTTSSYGISAWADDIGFYKSIDIVTTATAGTDTVILSTTSGVVVGQYVNIVSYDPGLTTSTLFAEQLSFSDTAVRVVAINSSTRSVKFTSTLTETLSQTSRTTLIDGTLTTVYSIAEVEFWSYDSETTILDSAIYGGTWSTGTRIAALGINPEDITIIGDSFVAAKNGYAPEELVPGEINESVGINVYTKNPEGAPVVLSSYYNIEAGTTSTRLLSIIPPNYASINVVYEGEIFRYNSTTNFTTSTEFNINWATNEIIIPPQSISGQLGYTIVSIGGGRDSVEAGVINYDTITVVTDTALDEYTSAQIQSVAILGTVKSAYVTVNGVSIPEVNTTTSYGYMLTTASGGSNRAAVNVYNLPNGTNTITAWFFGTGNRYFNEINEQSFIWTSTTTAFTLTMPPGIIEPAVGQMIVELNDNLGRRILRPPHIVYYEVLNPLVTTYSIGNTGTLDYTSVRVYLNGRKLESIFDFTISGSDVIFSIGLDLRDVIAIESTPSDNVDYDYIYDSSVLTLTSASSVPEGELRVITYNNHDDMLIRTERFNGIENRRYRISRPALDEDYVWVVVNGVPLVNHHDFELLDDSVTVQVSDEYEHTATDEIVITSISSSKLAETVLGYRIFNDIFNRTHFKRLSKQNTTYLTKELYFSDTSIHVADAGVLTQPVPSKNIPGVVLIDGERIEFFQVNNNVLSQLRRSTLGTSPSFYSESMSKVIDQGPDQTVPFEENYYRQDQITEYAVNEYPIIAVDHVINTGTHHQFANDGITLSASIDPNDQILVYYGGRLLRKTGVFTHDITMSYDSPVLSTVSITATTIGLPYTEVLGTAYIVTATNYVWVYSNSNKEDAVNGYEYTGLRYLPPEFTVNTITNQIVLNIEEGVQAGIKLTVIKRDFARTAVWNTEETTSTTVSLMESETTPARFLQARPAELPDKYYYGGDPALTEDSGFAILDEDNDPLEGY